MREHPIPQDITNYRFHIIGSMTLKQFAEIFLGVIIALVFYSTNLPDIVKWIFIILSVGLGAASAFIPIEERPLDHWIITFFRVLYKPTKYFWTRKPHIPDAFLYQPRANQEVVEPELDLSPAKRERIKEYLTSVNTPSEYQSDLSSWEASRVQQISDIFAHTPTAAPTQQPKKKVQPTTKPELGVRVRNLRSSAFKVQRTGDETTIYQQFNQEITPIETLPVVDLSKFDTPRDLSYPDSQVSQQNYHDQVYQQTDPVQVPNVEDVAADQQILGDEAEQAAADELPKPDVSYIQNERQTSAVFDTAKAAAFNQDLPFPDPPTESNKIVGMVLTPNNELITNAIVEVQTETGQIVRAVKTNALGQFFITTPLNNGSYVAKVEKQGYDFEPLKIVLSGDIVDPLEIRSL